MLSLKQLPTDCLGWKARHTHQQRTALGKCGMSKVENETGPMGESILTCPGVVQTVGELTRIASERRSTKQRLLNTLTE